MKKKITWLIVSCLMALSLVIASCGPAVVEEEEEEEEVVVEEEEEEEEEVVVVEEKGPQYGGVLKVPQETDIRGWDDAVTGHHMLWNVHPVQQPLMRGDWARGPAGTGEFSFFLSDARFDTKMGALVESWEVFPEGSFVYKVRQGIHYGLNPDSEASRLVGGRELTADDIAYSLNRLIAEPRGYIPRSSPAMVAEVKITALDKWTLEIAMSPEQCYGGNYFLGFYAYGDTAREVVEKYGDMKNWRNAVGTGPFFVTDYVPASSVTFARNPNFYEKDPCGPGKGNQLPYLDGFKRLIIPDMSTRLAALRTGKIDYFVGLYLDDAGTVFATSPQLESKQGVASSASTVNFRTDFEEHPCHDIRVRQALMMATDFQTIIDETMGGYGRIPSWPCVWTPEMADFVNLLEDLDERTRELYTYNPEKAKEYLAAAGYPGGFKAEIIVSSISRYVEEVSIIKDMWEKVGVELVLDVKESGAFSAIQTGRTHTDMIYGTTASTGLMWPRGAGVVSGDTFANTSMINLEYVEQGRLDMQAAWLRSDYEEMYRVSREDMIKPLLWEAWAIPYPQKPIFTFWWPWLKNFYGAASPGAFTGPAYRYMWIDQDLKKSMGY